MDLNVWKEIYSSEEEFAYELMIGWYKNKSNFKMSQSLTLGKRKGYTRKEM